jgi:hypothetical protein
MERTKDFRIHQKERKINKAFKDLKNWGFLHETDAQIRLRAKKMADNMKCNQCQCCCNPRRSKAVKGESKLTVQERRAPDINQELEDAYVCIDLE